MLDTSWVTVLRSFDNVDTVPLVVSKLADKVLTVFDNVVKFPERVDTFPFVVLKLDDRVSTLPSSVLNLVVITLF